VKFLVSHCEGYLTPVDVLVATMEKKMKRYTDTGHSESGVDFG
jgi:hypothetical protein